MDATDSSAITRKVHQLEAIAHSLAEAYRLDLETKLGKPFSVCSLTCYDWAISPEDYFYKLRIEDIDFGIILPISKQALLGNSSISPSIYKQAHKNLTKRGFAVYYKITEDYNLVEIARQNKRKK